MPAATLMDGEAAAAAVLAGVAGEVAQLHWTPGFATVVVSDDPAEHRYAALKHDAARQAGIEPFEHRLPASAQEEEVLERLARLGADDRIDGVFVQLPLPPHLDEARVLAAVDPAKDVDGLHPYNAGRLLLGDSRCLAPAAPNEADSAARAHACLAPGPTLVPATALAVLELLSRHEVPLRGARALVIGASRYAAAPTALRLLAEHATVTVCPADAPTLARHLAAADVVVSAAGVPGLVTAELVKAGAAVVDAGLRGDVEPAVAGRAAYLAPVPGGVGPLTIAMLLRNTVRAARYRRAAAG